MPTYAHLLGVVSSDHKTIIKKVLARRYGETRFDKIINLLGAYGVCESTLHKMADVEQIKMFNTYIMENRIRRKKHAKK